MKKKNLLMVVIAIFVFMGFSYAQNIAISDVTHTADASAVLDVYSTSKGMLVPRMNAAPSSPATGLIYYNTSSNTFQYYDGSTWLALSNGQLWSRNGTDTYLTNMGDNVVIGANVSPAPGVKFYVHSPTPQVIQLDGKTEFFDIAAAAGGNLLAEIDRFGAAQHGIFNIYDGGMTNTISLFSAGNSYIAGGNLGVGGTNPSHLLHVIDHNSFMIPQLQIDNPTGVGNASLGYDFAGMTYSEGVDGQTGNYKICNTPGLSSSSQGDGTTMLRAFQNGIVDLNNQSRSRVFQNTDMVQNIPTNTWQPIDFIMPNFDQHGEWILGFGSPVGGPPVSFFVAKEEGYYQVNSRTEYIIGEDFNNWWVLQDAYVSIAIYKGDVNGNWNMYAQGNNLQIGQAWNTQQGEMEFDLSFKNNNAPNVSDVVYLQKGEMIAIYTWQSSGITLPLLGGTAKTYCSIHKSS